LRCGDRRRVGDGVRVGGAGGSRLLPGLVDHARDRLRRRERSQLSRGGLAGCEQAQAPPGAKRRLPRARALGCQPESKGSWKGRKEALSPLPGAFPRARSSQGSRPGLRSCALTGWVLHVPKPYSLPARWRSVIGGTKPIIVGWAGGGWGRGGGAWRPRADLEVRPTWTGGGIRFSRNKAKSASDSLAERDWRNEPNSGRAPLKRGLSGTWRI
jgi:hypothetical protein